MRTLNRYLALLYIRNLAVILGVLVGLYGLIEFLERVDDFIEQGAALIHYLRYPIYKLPLMTNQAMPMAMLLAAFATIGHLSRTQQITALRSGGVSFWQTTRPLFAVGVIFSALMLASNCWVVPWSTREARYIMDAEVRKKTVNTEVTRDLYVRDGEWILSVANAYPRRGEIRGITLLQFDRHFNLATRLDADTAKYEGNNQWRLQTTDERRFGEDGRQVVDFTKHDELLINLGRGPQELTDIWTDPAELTFFELSEVSARLQREGQDSRRYLSELHFRSAQSLMPLIVILLGVPFALQRGRQATLGLGVALSLAVFIIYLVLQAVGMALGSAGLLPLPVAAWAANVLLMLIGAWLFLTLDS